MPKNLTSIDCGDIADGRIHRLYKNYQDRLINLNAADFGDLLLHVINILVSHPGVLSEFQARPDSHHGG